MSLLLLLACASTGHRPQKADPAETAAPDRPTDSAGDSSTETPLPWTDDACAAVDLGDDPFAADYAAFAADDAAAAPPAGGLLVVGSSTIRRWRSMARVLSPWDPLQRGVGGARLTDLLQHEAVWLQGPAPRAILLFAGTNDLADGRSLTAVFDAWRCLAQATTAAGLPLFTIGITPTPARWTLWETAAAFNAAVSAVSHPLLHYIDSPSAFLATGAPPDPALFVEDGLHLSAAGYALFEESVLASLHADLPPSAAALPAPPPVGSYLRVDLGPSNPEDGLPAPAIDAFGIHWNTFAPATGGAQLLAGRALRGLVTTTGASTAVSLTVSGGLRSNGLRNGGLLHPDGALLGTLAVPEATADFVYSGDPDDPAGLTLGGLDPDGAYTLRLFASRATTEERRTTTFTVHGAGPPASASVLTSGPAVGVGGYDGNNSVVTVLTGLRPDPRGRLHLDLERDAAFLYLNLLELEATTP